MRVGQGGDSRGQEAFRRGKVEPRTACTTHFPPKRIPPSAHAPTARQPSLRDCACAGRPYALRAAGGGRSEQGGKNGRKGRCFAARPREGECGALCARRPGVGAAVRPSARGQPRCRGRPLEARGGQPRRTWPNWGRGGCGGGCRKDWRRLRASPLHKKSVADTAVRFPGAGL